MHVSAQRFGVRTATANVRASTWMPDRKRIWETATSHCWRNDAGRNRGLQSAATQNCLRISDPGRHGDSTCVGVGPLGVNDGVGKVEKRNLKEWDMTKNGDDGVAQAIFVARKIMPLVVKSEYCRNAIDVDPERESEKCPIGCTGSDWKVDDAFSERDGVHELS